MSTRSIVATYDQDLNQRLLDFRTARTNEDKQRWANDYLKLFLAQRPYLARNREGKG